MRVASLSINLCFLLLLFRSVLCKPTTSDSLDSSNGDTVTIPEIEENLERDSEQLNSAITDFETEANKKLPKTALARDKMICQEAEFHRVSSLFLL